MGSLRIAVRRVPGGARAIFSVGDIHIGATSDDAPTALHAAAGLATDLTRALKSHPELAPLVGPNTLAALTAVKAAAWAYRHGGREALQRVGPTAAGVVRSLLRRFH